MAGTEHEAKGFLLSRSVVFILAAATCLFGAGLSHGSDKPEEVSGLFPEIDGWSKDGIPRTYDPETLYEYIDGAADLYITYDFQELHTLNYEKGDGQGLTIDIYRQSTPRNGFGIYSQEKSIGGNFVSIGAEGYYDKGILNFVLGDYYVKIAGFYLGEEDESLLTSVAEDVADRLDEKPGFPIPLSCFPDSGRIAHSERYVAVDFLGHAFLHSAYAAEYETEGQKFRLFVIEADDERDALEMLESYVKLAEEKGEEVVVSDGRYRFGDPYYLSGGKMNITQSGMYLWGLLTDSASVATFYLDEVGRGLAKHGLLEKGPAD